MFNKLKSKWKVPGWRLLLILMSFATGGSLCGYAGRQLISLLSIDNDLLWVVIYVCIVTLLWPVCVLSVSLPLGQFNFFRKYIFKLFTTMTSRNNKENLPAGKVKLAIFASGAGTNALQIIRHFTGHPHIMVSLVVCNKPGAGVTTIAAQHGIPVLMIEKDQFFNGNAYIDELAGHGINWIILAGFLWKVPVALISAFPDHIINIHPALLPKYGGKGMYGRHVHEAVRQNKDAETGISIHFVDERYDHGKIIFQASCAVTGEDDAGSIAEKVHRLEHKHYPIVIEKTIKSKSIVKSIVFNQL